MKTYQSHKRVESGRISSMVPRGENYSVGVDGDSEHFRITKAEGLRIIGMAGAVGMTLTEGNLVVYKGGYISWSPADVFDDGYREVDAATFGMAIEGLHRGERWERAGWNGKGMYIELQVPDEHSKMQRPYIFMAPVGGELVPWLASQSDMLADDWVRVDD